MNYKINRTPSSPINVLIVLYLLASVLSGVLTPLIFYSEEVKVLVLIVIVITFSAVGLAILWWQRNSVPFSLFFLVAPFALLQWREILQTQVNVVGVPVNLSDGVVLSYLLIQGLVALRRERRESWQALPEWFFLLALAVGGIGLGFVFGNSPYYILQNARSVFYLIGVFLATYSLVHTKTRIQEAIYVLVVLGLLTALTTLRIGVIGIERSVDFISINTSMASVVDVVGMTTILYVVGYLLVLCRLVLSPGLTRRVALDIIFLLFFLVTMVFSGIRTTWIVVSLTSLYILAVSKRMKLGLVLVILMSILAGVLLTANLISTMTGEEGRKILSGRLDVSESFSSRLEESRQAVIAVIEQRGWFFGNGFGAAFDISGILLDESGTGYYTFVHNAYVWFFLKLGLLGLLCILVIIGRIFRITFVGFRLSKGKDDRWMVLAANAIVLALAIDALTASTMVGTIGGATVSGIILALALRLGKAAARQRKPVMLSSPNTRRDKACGYAPEHGA